jgi:Asp-tRNA(Asn)/Glu-tRNA(Gln) amidotransferase A subunit family amidase
LGSFGGVGLAAVELLEKMSFTMAADPYRQTATVVLARIRQGDLTVEQYAWSLLSRIQSRDPIVKAWAYLDADHVIEDAKILDQVPVKERGPLHGIAIGVKDVIYTKGRPDI